MQPKRTAIAATLIAAAAAPNASAMIAGGAGNTGAVAIADARPATRYFDIEGNKASSMRALGLHMATDRSLRPAR